MKDAFSLQNAASISYRREFIGCKYSRKHSRSQGGGTCSLPSIWLSSYLGMRITLVSTLLPACSTHQTLHFGDQEAYIVASLNTWKYGRSRGSPRRVLRQSDRCRALWCACCQSDQCYTRGVLACWYNDHNDIAVLQLIRKLKCE